MLLESKHWFVDGTFRSTPNLFYQTYVILAERYGGIHPIVYALLPNKQSSTYEQMLNLLTDLEPNLAPNSITCDFEMAAIKAFKKKFPDAVISGCFFHLVKNLKKKVMEINLLSRYNNEADISLKVRMISSLAFVPVADLDDAVDLLAEELPPELQPLLEWFEDFYIGRPNRRGKGRRQALFPPALWSVYERVLSDKDRTNNHAEAAHRRLQSELSMDHPVLWKFIDTLRKIQFSRDMLMEQLILGQKPPQKLKKYRDADIRIKTVVADYGNRNLIEYLRGISHNYEMNS